MTDGGFHARRRSSPTSLLLVLLLHAGVIGAVLMAKGPMRTIIDNSIDYYPVPEPTPPEPIPEPPPQPRTSDQQPTRVPATTPLPTPFPQLPDRPIDTRPVDIGPIGDPIPLPVPDPPRPDPVRREAEVDRRYADALQPPYPLAQQRAQRSGMVRLRVTIGVDGRVRAAERLFATHDDFWQVAERQALTRWRFRPATVDGRPVESTKVMTIHFRIADA